MGNLQMILGGGLLGSGALIGAIYWLLQRRGSQDMIMAGLLLRLMHYAKAAKNSELLECMQKGLTALMNQPSETKADE